MAGVLKKKGLVQVRVYLNAAEFSAMAKDAEKAQKRRVGLQLQTQKPHGLDGEYYSNTNGISKFLKYTWAYWKENEAHRLQKGAEIAQKEKELAEEKKRLGLG